MKTLVVTAALIRKESSYLIAQRKKGTHQEMMWEFPGGKIEPGESPEHCLEREIEEELNLKIAVGDIYHVVSHNYGDRHIILLCYLSTVIEGDPEIVDCEDFRWVTPEEMKAYKFAPADIPVVEKLVQDVTSKQRP